jgi:hypothetical protein
MGEIFMVVLPLSPLRSTLLCRFISAARILVPIFQFPSFAFLLFHAFSSAFSLGLSLSASEPH